MDKLYVIVRNDLPPGDQLAQSCHGLDAFIVRYPGIHRHWHESSRNIAVLQAQDEAALLELVQQAQERGIACATYSEPDFEDQLTAIALGPGGHKVSSYLPLALRGLAA